MEREGQNKNVTGCTNLVKLNQLLRHHSVAFAVASQFLCETEFQFLKVGSVQRNAKTIQCFDKDSSHIGVQAQEAMINHIQTR